MKAVIAATILLVSGCAPWTGPAAGGFCLGWTCRSIAIVAHEPTSHEAIKVVPIAAILGEARQVCYRTNQGLVVVAAGIPCPSRRDAEFPVLMGITELGWERAEVADLVAVFFAGRVECDGDPRGCDGLGYPNGLMLVGSARPRYALLHEIQHQVLIRRAGETWGDGDPAHAYPLAWARIEELEAWL